MPRAPLRPVYDSTCNDGANEDIESQAITERHVEVQSCDPATTSSPGNRLDHVFAGGSTQMLRYGGNADEDTWQYADTQLLSDSQEGVGDKCGASDEIPNRGHQGIADLDTQLVDEDVASDDAGQNVTWTHLDSPSGRTKVGEWRTVSKHNPPSVEVQIDKPVDDKSGGPIEASAGPSRDDPDNRFGTRLGGRLEALGSQGGGLQWHRKVLQDDTPGEDTQVRRIEKVWEPLIGFLWLLRWIGAWCVTPERAHNSAAFFSFFFFFFFSSSRQFYLLKNLTKIMRKIEPYPEHIVEPEDPSVCDWETGRGMGQA